MTTPLLIQRLNDGLQSAPPTAGLNRTLTLVSDPAGFSVLARV